MRAPDQLEAAPFVAVISLAARARAASRLALCLLFWIASPGLAWASLTGLSGLDASRLPDLPSKLETTLEPRPGCVAFCAPALRIELEASTLAGRVPDSWHPFGPGDRQNQALFATEWGSGIVDYANDNPARFVDPTGHYSYENTYGTAHLSNEQQQAFQQAKAESTVAYLNEIGKGVARKAKGVVTGTVEAVRKYTPVGAGSEMWGRLLGGETVVEATTAVLEWRLDPNQRIRTALRQGGGYLGAAGGAAGDYLEERANQVVPIERVKTALNDKASLSDRIEAGFDAVTQLALLGAGAAAALESKVAAAAPNSPTGGMRSAPTYQGLRQPKPVRATTSPTLLPDELLAGRFDDIPQIPHDRLTPHHMPSAEYMLQRAGVAPGRSLAMNVEAPRVSGRHVRTETFGRSPFLDEVPRDALARDIANIRRVYQQDALYGSRVRAALQDYIRLSKETFPELFGK